MQSYGFLYQEQQTGFADSSEPKLSEVVDGQVVAVDGAPVQTLSRRISISLLSLPTIEDIVTRIQEAVGMGAFDVQISDDEETGLPPDIHAAYDDQVLFSDEWTPRQRWCGTPYRTHCAGCVRKLAVGCAFSAAFLTTIL